MVEVASRMGRARSEERERLQEESITINNDSLLKQMKSG